MLLDARLRGHDEGAIIKPIEMKHENPGRHKGRENHERLSLVKGSHQ